MWVGGKAKVSILNHRLLATLQSNVVVLVVEDPFPHPVQRVLKRNVSTVMVGRVIGIGRTLIPDELTFWSIPSLTAGDMFKAD